MNGRHSVKILVLILAPAFLSSPTIIHGQGRVFPGAPVSAINSPVPGFIGSTLFAVQPLPAQPCPSTMSDDASLVHRPANRHANRSRSDVGMMSDDGR